MLLLLAATALQSRLGIDARTPIVVLYEDVDFEDGEKVIKLVGDPAMIRRFASMNGREPESKLLNDNVKKSVLILGEFKSGANFVSQVRDNPFT